MSKLLITLLAIASPVAAMADPIPATIAAIHALYTADNAAQRSVDAAVCHHGKVVHLDDEGMRQFTHVMFALAAAMIDDPDNAERDFCEAAGER